MPYPEAISHFSEATQLFIRKIHNRVESGKNALILVVGETGSGKSYSCIELALGLYLYRHGKPQEAEDFMSHLSFTLEEFLTSLQGAEMKKKQIYIWEEAGVSINNKKWQSKTNQIMGYLTQTFRTLQHIVFINVPCTSFIDKTVRQLLHYEITARRIDKKQKLCFLRPLELQYNNTFNKLYRHGLIMITQKGTMEIDEISVGLAPKEYIIPYEERKASYTKGNIEKWRKELAKDRLKKDGKVLKPLTTRQIQIVDCINKLGIKNPTEIGKKIDWHPSNVEKNIGFIQQKGYELKLEEIT